MMLWRKVGTLFRASAHEPVEKLVDANALRILAQELRETEDAMVGAKRELAGLMAESKQLQRSNERLAQTITEREGQARHALELDEEALATELAERIAEDENLLAEQRRHADYLAAQEKTLRKRLQDAGRTLQHYKRELSLAKANHNAEKVLKELGSHTAGLHTHMSDLAASVDRIKAQQERTADVNDSLQELAEEELGSHLDRKLEKAGIDNGKHDAKAVLARLRAKDAPQAT
ncbi:PspA/IM30 family protein [Marinobacter bohaiensis]|uniref:PspA/IM30 family protein n=1 Tax=Marinobacter bohaiensis TaxID=2201898 RepID=UPI000DADE6B9|nr:PspA/IM30 family protein [Marinobacter bohaiensis]